ncbi:MAG TPA: endonuclease III [Patescibacteria group bacterium]|nr:endonuclease III [Patescibacteria group bacterium]
MKREKIEALFAKLKAQNPEPKGELEYVNHFTLLVAVVLSAQATDAGVNKATKSLFNHVKTPQQMLDLGIEKLTDYIKTIGLYKGKAKNVIALSQMLVEKHGGRVPRTMEQLIELPGVGRKTGNVVLNIAYGEPTMAVDTHVFRVSNRTKLAPGRTPEEVEEKLLKVVPQEYRQHAHHWLILHGRYICKARFPECARCPIYNECEFREKTA